jgi:hypothetical protein
MQFWLLVIRWYTGLKKTTRVMLLGLFDSQATVAFTPSLWTLKKEMCTTTVPLLLSGGKKLTTTTTTYIH